MAGSTHHQGPNPSSSPLLRPAHMLDTRGRWTGPPPLAEWPACKPPNSPGFPNSSALGPPQTHPGGQVVEVPGTAQTLPKSHPGIRGFLVIFPTLSTLPLRESSCHGSQLKLQGESHPSRKWGQAHSPLSHPHPGSLNPGAPPWQGWRPSGLSASLLRESGQNQPLEAGRPPSSRRGGVTVRPPAGARGRPTLGSRLDSWALP